MPPAHDAPPPRRLLIVMPTWLGDCVMATPTLRALRALYPDARIAALVKANVRPILDGCPWLDRVLTIRTRRAGQHDRRRRGMLRLSRRLAAGQFDAAILLPNSFRTAMMVSLAGIPRRIGYDRDGRGFMLTDRLLPRRDRHGFVPVPARDYYLGIARYLGAIDPDPTMQLFITGDERRDAAALFDRAQLDPARPLVLLNPGASKPEKRWPPDRFAELADHLVKQHRATVAVTGAPREVGVLRDVQRHAHAPVVNLAEHGLTLGAQKAVIQHAQLLVTNDTGPRHVAAALGTPVVTLFGPTDPAWTVIDFPLEKQLVSAEKRMDALATRDAYAAADELLQRRATKGTA